MDALEKALLRTSSHLAIDAAVASERERCAQMIERADNTMMQQDKLANHIRGLKR